MPISLFANTLSLCPSLKLTDQLSPPYKQDYGWVRFKLHVLRYRRARQKVPSSMVADFSRNYSALNYSKHAIFLFENNFVKYVYFTTFSSDLLTIVKLRFCQTFCLRNANIRIYGFLGTSSSSSLLTTEEFSLSFCIVFMFWPAI